MFFLVIFALFVLFFSGLIWGVSFGLSRADRAHYRLFSTLFLRSLFELGKRIYGILFLPLQKRFLNFAPKINTQNPWKKFKNKKTKHKLKQESRKSRKLRFPNIFQTNKKRHFWKRSFAVQKSKCGKFSGQNPQKVGAFWVYMNTK